MGPLLGVIDFFIANIGINSIRTSLQAGFGEIELVIAGYGLTYAVCLITGGRLGDIFGRKLTFISGMAGFTLTSALCGLAPTAAWLIFWRLVQGCAAAVMFPQALSFIHVNFSGSSKRVAYRPVGSMLSLPFFLALKAEALHLAGRTAEALETISEAEALVERFENRYWCAELHRLRGVFLAAIGAEETQIEASFTEAIRIAREQKSVFLQKRAEVTYAEYRRQKASASGGRGIRLPL